MQDTEADRLDALPVPERFPLQVFRDGEKVWDETNYVPWEEGLIAMTTWYKQFGGNHRNVEQAAKRMAERGGLSEGEFYWYRRGLPFRRRGDTVWNAPSIEDPVIAAIGDYEMKEKEW